MTSKKSGAQNQPKTFEERIEELRKLTEDTALAILKMSPNVYQMIIALSKLYNELSIEAGDYKNSRLGDPRLRNNVRTALGSAKAELDKYKQQNNTITGFVARCQARLDLYEKSLKDLEDGKQVDISRINRLTKTLLNRGDALRGVLTDKKQKDIILDHCKEVREMHDQFIEMYILYKPDSTTARNARPKEDLTEYKNRIENLVKLHKINGYMTEEQFEKIKKIKNLPKGFVIVKDEEKKLLLETSTGQGNVIEGRIKTFVEVRANEILKNNDLTYSEKRAKLIALQMTITRIVGEINIKSGGPQGSEKKAEEEVAREC